MAKAINLGRAGERIRVRMDDNTIVEFIAGNDINSPDIQIHDRYVFSSASERVQTEDRDLFKTQPKPKPSCLQPCVITPNSFWRADRVLETEILGATRVVEIDFKSYRYDDSRGECIPVTDGSGDYDTSFECVNANFKALPEYQVAADPGKQSDVRSTNAASQDNILGGGNDPNGRYPIEDFPVGINTILTSSGVEPYLRPVSGGLEILGENGIVIGNNFSVLAIVETQGTTFPTSGFNPDRYAWMRYGDPDFPPTGFFSSSLAGSINSGIFTVEGSPITNFTLIAPNTYQSRILTTDFAGVLSLGNFQLRWDSTQFADNLPSEAQNSFLDSEFNLTLTLSLVRNVFAVVPSYLVETGYFAKIHDPDTPLTKVGPSKFNGAIAEEDLGLKRFFFQIKDKVYVVTKEGKERAPEKTYNEREWQRITRSEFDLSSGAAILTETEYNNPDPIPELDDNPIAEQSDSYLDTVPYSNNCVEGEDPNLFLAAVDALPETDKSVYQEIALQEKCTGELTEYRVPGVIVPTS